MTFCHIFEVVSRVRQKVVDCRSVTIEKWSVKEKKSLGDKRSLVAGSLMTGSTVSPDAPWENPIRTGLWQLISIFNMKLY